MTDLCEPTGDVMNPNTRALGGRGGGVLVTFSLLRPDARKPTSELCGARDGEQRTAIYQYYAAIDW